jgi:hypothetical protein
VLPDIRKGIALLVRLQTSSPALPSDKSRIKVKDSMKRWWNDADSGKLMYAEKNLSQCYLVHHTLIWTRPASNPDLRG